MPASWSVTGAAKPPPTWPGTTPVADLRFWPARPLPHSLGLFYEQATSHLGFLHSSDEYKVMALASYGTPRFARELGRLVYPDGAGGFRTEVVDWDSLVKRRAESEPLTREHADLAASVQRVTEDVLLDLARWLHGRTGDRALAMAGGVALNCVANSRLHREGPFDRIWVQPAAGDAGTALGAALLVASEAGETVMPMPDALPGPGLVRRRTRSLAGHRGLALRAAGQRRRRDRRRTGRRPHRRPGSRAAASSVPGRWAAAHCSPTPAAGSTWTG